MLTHLSKISTLKWVHWLWEKRIREPPTKHPQTARATLGCFVGGSRVRCSQWVSLFFTEKASSTAKWASGIRENQIVSRVQPLQFRFSFIAAHFHFSSQNFLPKNLLWRFSKVLTAFFRIWLNIPFLHYNSDGFRFRNWKSRSCSSHLGRF